MKPKHGGEPTTVSSLIHCRHIRWITLVTRSRSTWNQISLNIYAISNFELSLLILHASLLKHYFLLCKNAISYLFCGESHRTKYLILQYLPSDQYCGNFVLFFKEKIWKQKFPWNSNYINSNLIGIFLCT